MEIFKKAELNFGTLYYFNDYYSKNRFTDFSISSDAENSGRLYGNSRTEDLIAIPGS